MAQIVYLLCGILSIVCAVMLFRGYQGARTRLLLWSSLCFSFLAINNVILIVDVVIFPQLDFSGALLRNIAAAIAGSLLLFGLIWELT